MASREPEVTPGERRWLLACLLLVLLPHVGRLPLWVTSLAALVGLWQARPRLREVVPPRWLAPTLAMTGTAAVLLQLGTLFGKQVGLVLLVLLLAFKLLELRTRRDALAAVFLSYFLVAVGLLFAQSMAVAAYLSAVAVVITATLVAVTQPAAGFGIRARLGLAGALVGQALPLTLVLFVLFPRVTTPLWVLPADAYSGVTGLGETMEPGSISMLAQSDAVAFRARIEGPVPSSEQRYWRGPVLWYTDGRAWRGGAPGSQREGHVALAGLQLAGTPVRQHITLEPHQGTWLFGLDLPVQVSAAARPAAGLDWRSAQPVREPLRYDVLSFPEHHGTRLPALDRARALQIPEHVDPRVSALAAQFTRGRDARGTARAALAYFHDQPFRYTLAPPVLRRDPTADFLFETRAGFCEHYAAAFTLLMRLAGIPARVVTGYLGGEWNPLGEYWVVRQSDAHAWSEAWIAGSGWVRMDATAAIAPERVERFGTGASPVVASLRFAAGDLVARVARELRFAADAMNDAWNRSVLGFGPERQQALLSRLGLHQPSWRTLALASTLAGGAVTLLVAAVLLLRMPRDRDAARAVYTRWCRRLARRGILRRPAEGPRDFAARAVQLRPDLRAPIADITERYIALRYGRIEAAAPALRELQRRVRRFRC